MDRRQYVFLGAGVALACLALGVMIGARVLDPPPALSEAALSEAAPPTPPNAAPAPPPPDPLPADEPGPAAPRLPPGLPQALVDMLGQLDPNQPQGDDEPEAEPAESSLPPDLDLRPPGSAEPPPDVREPVAADESPAAGSPSGDQPDPTSKVAGGADAGTGSRSPAQQLGPFRVVEEEDDLVSVYGPDGEVFVSTFRGAHIGLAGELGRRPALLLVEKTCPDPCNPRSQLFIARGRSVEPLVDVQGMIRLVDLDKKPPAEMLVDHLMETTSELVTLPFRFERGRFVNDASRAPELIDSQLTRLAATAEERCAKGLDSTCTGALRAFVGLAFFRSGPKSGELIAQLQLSPMARELVEQIREEVTVEIESLAE